MLRAADMVHGYKVRASDGSIGKVTDLYFDDRSWTVRHFVVQTGGWFGDRRVLVAPRAMGPIDPDSKGISTALTRAEIEASPRAESDRPVSERMEHIYSESGWSFWPAVHPWEEMLEEGDPHLRSAQEVEGYYVHATDGDIGHVAGFVVDDSDWVIRYLLVDTRNVWPGRFVLVSPEWVKEIDWDEAKLHVNLTRAAIRDSPRHEPASPVTREYETALCRFYQREGYWTREPCPEDQQAMANKN